MAAPKSGPTAKIELDHDQVEALARIGCTMAEMAAFFKCSVSTLEINYHEPILRGRDASKASVRRMMWKHGELGNSTALKYLVTNILKEKIEDRSLDFLATSGQEVIEKLNQVSTETILKIVRAQEKVS